MPPAKKGSRNKAPSKRWKMYVKDGESLKKKNRECPKCGSGIFMAKHANRETCGKCGYSEFSKKA